MESYSTQLYEEMTDRLHKLDVLATDPISKAREAVGVIRETLKKLRDRFSCHIWKEPQQEIGFFKHIKPSFQSRLIYHLKIFHLESRYAALTDMQFKALLEEELARIVQFFQQNSEFYQYYITGATYLDECFFIRGQFDLNLVDDELFMALDPQFATVHSYKVSIILAYKALTGYLNSRLSSLEISKPALSKKWKIRWTATKADLIELLYALHSAGVVNHSEVDVSIMAKILEAAFSIDLGNYYRAFQDIRTRKKNRTFFLDRLKKALLMRMDATDLSPAEEPVSMLSNRLNT